ncbi:MAG: T9SS type A sorting domain-containing protein [Lacibacter sp.]
MRTENSFSITSNGVKPLGYFSSFYSNNSSFFQTIKINRILPVTCIGFILFLISLFPSIVSGQATGDYRTNAASLNWNAASNWQRWNGSTWVSNPSQGFPGQNTGTGTVTILNGHSVILNTSPGQSIGSLVVGGGTNGSLTIGNNNSDRTLRVAGNITINSGATINSAGNGGNLLNIGGNLINNGTFDLRIGAATTNVTFNGSSNQTVSGTGTTTDFNNITINNSGATANNIVELMPSNLTATAGFLTLTRGIIKMSGTYTFSNTFFSTANPTINPDEGIWLNNSNVIVSGQNGDTQLSGLLRITAGIYNVGITADWWLYYNSGAVITVEGGALNISGVLAGSAVSSTVTYSQSNGTVTVCTVGNSNSIPSFGIEAAGSSFTMSGGSIIVQNAATIYDDYINNATTSSVTGGTVQFGNASTPSSSLFYMRSTPAFYDLQVNSVNNPTVRLFTATTYLNDITIGGVLDAATNNVNIAINRNWINNGSFLPGTATVTFNSTTQAQSISGTANTTFYNLTNNNTNAAGLSLSGDVTVSNTLALSSASNGKISIGANNLTIGSGGSITGANSSRYIVTSPTSVTNGRLRQNNLAASARVFPIGTTSNYLPATVTPSSSGSDFSISVFRGTTINGDPAGTAFGSRVHQADAIWQIDRASGSSNAHIRLDWATNSIEGSTFTGLANSAIGIWRFTGSNWLLIPSPTVLSIDNSANYAATASTAMSSFGTAGTGYPYLVGNVSVLPSALKSFSASKANSGNQLTWEVENADQFQLFELQESKNGIDFTNKTSVAPGSASRYSYLDAGSFTATKYYRLKLTDRQRNVSYSHVVSIGGKKDTKIVLLQNPVQHQLNFRHPEAVNAQYSVVDLSGRIMMQGVVSKHAVISSVNTSTLNNGAYVLRFTDGGENYSQTFIKQ